MATLRFPGPEVWRHLKLSLDAKTHTPTFDQQVERIQRELKCSEDEAWTELFSGKSVWSEAGPDVPAGLLLVKDEGIYLMANTREGWTPGDVVYAKGYDPTKQDRDDLWEKTHRVSGDDFSEFIPASMFPEARYEDPRVVVEIRLTSRSLSVRVLGDPQQLDARDADPLFKELVRLGKNLNNAIELWKKAPPAKKSMAFAAIMDCRRPYDLFIAAHPEVRKYLKGGGGTKRTAESVA